MARYVVCAKNENGDLGPRSEEFSLFEPGDEHTQLDWTAIPGVTGYRVFRDMEEDPEVDEFDEYFDTTNNFLEVVLPEDEEFTAGWTPTSGVQPPESSTATYKVIQLLHDDGGDDDEHNFIFKNLYIDQNHRLNLFEPGAPFFTGAWLQGIDNQIRTGGEFIAGTRVAGTVLSVGASYKFSDPGQINSAIIEGQLGVGVTNMSTKKVWVNGETFTTSLGVGGPGTPTPPANGLHVQGLTVLSPVTGLGAWGGDGQPQLGVQAGIGMQDTGAGGATGIYQWNTNADNTFGYSRERMIRFTSPTRNTHNIEVVAPANGTDDYLFVSAIRPSDGGTPRTVMRAVRDATTATRSYVQLVSNASDGYRWTTSTTFVSGSGTGTTETMITHAHSGVFLAGTGAWVMNYASAFINHPGVSTNSYMFLPLKLPRGGVITQYRIRVSSNPLGNVGIQGTLYKQEKNDDMIATAVVGGQTQNYNQSGTFDVTLTSPITETVEAGHRYFLYLQFGTAVAGGSLEVAVAEVDVTLDRHFPAWMG